MTRFARMTFSTFSDLELDRLVSGFTSPGIPSRFLDAMKDEYSGQIGAQGSRDPSSAASRGLGSEPSRRAHA